MSISNSNDRLPQLPFGKIWLLILLSLILFLIGWDWFWFSRNVVRLPNDDAELWSYHRRRVAREGDNSVVLIGTSRMQNGFNQDTFTELTNRKSIQLAVAGNSPIPVLQDLAEDESFHGTVISDFNEYLVYKKEIQPDSQLVTEGWIKAFHESKTSDDFEFWLRGYVKYLVANPILGAYPADVLKNVVIGDGVESQTGDKDKPKARPILFNRSRIFEFDLPDQMDQPEFNEKKRKGPVATVRSLYETNPPTPEKFLEIVNKIEGYVQKIQARGGKVIIVNFPISGELANLNEIVFPRKQFWDLLTAKTSAMTVHFKDYPQLQFECSDGSHLDAKDTPKFTEELVKIIYDKL